MIPVQTPPSNQPLTKEQLKAKWIQYAVGGMLLFSFGLCLFSEAAHLKHLGKDIATWVLLGTVSLISINAGLALFGQGILFKNQLDYKLRRKEDQKKGNAKKRYYKKPVKKKSKENPAAE